MVDPEGIRTIAFYLPQFARSPENNRWWQPGFTEWTNVLSAQPRWKGHRQPRLPGELGPYDLRQAQVLDQQVELARSFNISAFCFYHYWSLGHRLLGRFLDDFLSASRPDFPFCLSWGNHHWSRKWDAISGGMLMEQEYSDEDDDAHAAFLTSVFRDPRYVRVGGRPLFLVHLASGMPDPNRFLAKLHARCLSDVGTRAYVLHCSSVSEDRRASPAWDFDGVVDFQPNGQPDTPFIDDVRLAPQPLGPDAVLASRRNILVDYTQMQDRSRAAVLATSAPPYLHPCVMPDWDNTARRPHDRAMIFIGSTPERYRRWVQSARIAVRQRPAEERLIFVNGWNEWGEGAYLEPDNVWGRAYLEAHLP